MGIYLDEVKEKIIFADNYLNSGKPLENINNK